MLRDDQPGETPLSVTHPQQVERGMSLPPLVVQATVASEELIENEIMAFISSLNLLYTKHESLIALWIQT